MCVCGHFSCDEQKCCTSTVRVRVSVRYVKNLSCETDERRGSVQSVHCPTVILAADQTTQRRAYSPARTAPQQQQQYYSVTPTSTAPKRLLSVPSKSQYEYMYCCCTERTCEKRSSGYVRLYRTKFVVYTCGLLPPILFRHRRASILPRCSYTSLCTTMKSGGVSGYVQARDHKVVRSCGVMGPKVDPAKAQVRRATRARPCAVSCSYIK